MSVSTASRALSNSPNVNPETRALIQQVAADLGYRANPLAQNLRHGNHKPLILLLTDGETFSNTSITNYFSLLLKGLVNGLIEGDCAPVVITADSIEEFLTYPFAGIITCTPRTDTIEAAVLAFPHLPIVTVGDYQPYGNIYATLSYDVDDFVPSACNLLIERGAKRIAMLSNPNGVGVFMDPGINTYNLWCAENNQEPLNIAAIRPDDAHAGAQRLVTEHGIDGIFCFGAPAYAAASGVTDAGKKIPHECLMISWGTSELIAEYLPTPLSTIDLNPTQTGEIAVEAMGQALEGVRTHIVLPIGVTERASTLGTTHKRSTVIRRAQTTLKRALDGAGDDTHV